MFEKFSKRGKVSKRAKGMLGIKNERKSSMYEGCEFPGAPDPLERKYMRRYRKTPLGMQQYEGDE